MLIYELHLLILKMSNGSSYGETYKRLLIPYVKSIQRKKSFLSFSPSLLFSHSLNTSFLSFIIPYYILLSK